MAGAFLICIPDDGVVKCAQERYCAALFERRRNTMSRNQKGGIPGWVILLLVAAAIAAVFMLWPKTAALSTPVDAVPAAASAS